MALSAIESVVAEGALGADVASIRVVSSEHPGFSGSPTVLVDGEDPFLASRVDSRSCRLSATPEGPRNSPTEAMLGAACGELGMVQAEAL